MFDFALVLMNDIKKGSQKREPLIFNSLSEPSFRKVARETFCLIFYFQNIIKRNKVKRNQTLF